MDIARFPVRSALAASLFVTSTLAQQEMHMFGKRDDRNTGAIAGGAIGGFFALLFLVTLFLLILVITACKIQQRGSGGGGGGGGSSGVVLKSTKSSKESVGPTTIPAINQQNDLYGADDA